MTRKETGFIIVALVGAALFVATLAAALSAMRGSLTDFTGPSSDTLVLQGANLLALMGSLYVIAPVVLLGTAWLLWKRRPWGAAKLALLPLAGEALSVVIKTLVARPRPPNPFEESYSFPSGHATDAAIMACLVAWFAFREPRGRAAITILLALGAFWTLIMAADRLVLGVHYLTDVLGGVGLGLMVGGAGLAGISALQRSVGARKKEEASAPPRP